MDKFKDPAMILSIMDFIAILGTTYHFQTKCNALTAELQKVTQETQTMKLTSSTIIQNVAELKQENKQLHGLLRGLSNDISRLSEAVNSLPTTAMTQSLAADVDEIAQTLVDNEISVRLPSREKLALGAEINTP